MTTTLMIFQVVVTLLLIVVVLLQFGKGAEAGLMSGGESMMTGAQQGNILSKITVVLSILFMGNCILLSKIQSEKAGASLLDNEAPVARPLNSDAQTETAAPAEEAPQGEKKAEPKAEEPK